MRKIIIRAEMPGYINIENELVAWLKEKIETSKIEVYRDPYAEKDNIMSLRIRYRPITPTPLPDGGKTYLMPNYLPDNINGKSPERALTEILQKMLTEAREKKERIPDDGNPF